MVAKKSKLARLASNASRAGSPNPTSGPTSTGNSPPKSGAAKTNTQTAANKPKKRNRKAKKPPPGDLSPEKTEASRPLSAKEGSKLEPKNTSPSEPESKDKPKGSNEKTPANTLGMSLHAKHNVEKSTRSEPFIVNGVDRRSREGHMSGSQPNYHGNNVGNFWERGVTRSINSDHKNLPTKPPPGIDDYHTRHSSYKPSQTSFSSASSYSRHNHVARPCAAQQMSHTGYFTHQAIAFGGRTDSEGSSPPHSNPAAFQTSGGPSFPPYPVPHTHGGAMYPTVQGWDGYSNAFQAPQEPGQFFPPYPPVPHHPYGQPLYMPPYCPPVTGMPSPPYVSNSDHYPYTGASAPVGFHAWSTHHPDHSHQLESIGSQQEDLVSEQPQSYPESLGSGLSSERQSVFGDTTITNLEARQNENCSNYSPNGQRGLESPAKVNQAPPSESRSSIPDYGSSTPEETHRAYTEDLNQLSGLPGRLLDAFQTGNWADYQMVLESATKNFVPITFPIHAVVVSQSPRLNELLRTPSVAASRVIRVVAEGSFSQPTAAETCLRNLYGLPILTQPQLSCLPVLPHDFETTPDGNGLSQMEFALCYMVTGSFLSMPEISERGFELARNLICWDTLERVVKFGLEPHGFTIEILNEKFATPCSPFSEGSHDYGTESSTLRSESSVSDAANRLLMAAFEFIAYNMPPSLKLDTEAHASQMPERIPCDKVNLRGTVLSNPHLASVKFGDFESLNDRKPSYESTAISTILLELPFEYLSELFGVMKATSVLNRQLAQDIVAERERRRTRILRAREANGDSAIKSDEFGSNESKPLGWEESIMVRVNDNEESITLMRTPTRLKYLGTTRRGRPRNSGSRGSSSYRSP